MTATFWILLLIVAIVVAVATMRRTRPATRISDAERTRQLPSRDGNSDLGISAVRPVTSPRASVPAAPLPPTPAPARTEETSREWIGDVLDTPEAPSGETPSVKTEPVAKAVNTHSRPEPSVEAADRSEDIEAAGSDETVWTFDADAASPTRSRPTAYLRPAQALWSTAAVADAATLLAESLAARLSASVAVIQHVGDEYRVELLAGSAGQSPAAPMLEADHPLGRVPRDGVLSLLAEGAEAALTYHADPETTVGQALAQSLGTSSIFLVAGLPIDAPDVDDATAILVSQYAGLLAGLTDHGSDSPIQDLSSIETEADLEDTWEDALLSAPAIEVPRDLDLPDVDLPEVDLLADLAEDADTGDDPAEDETDTELEGDGEDADAIAQPIVSVATPGARRPAPPPPPRAVILNAEIDAARRDRRLLVFALVTLADAETVLRGGADDMVRAEAALRQRLASAPAVRRVEPFGDLVFGAFLDAEGPEVVAWAERISRAGAPILVGAVPASGSADAVRASATAALQHAYETEATCVVAS